MYNNTILQTSYKPYVPLPKKKTDKGVEQKQPEKHGQVVTPNNYSLTDERKSSADTYKKGNIVPSKININQLLIDFNSTLNAIGASEDVENEVKTYLSLVEHQSQKDSPNKKMIISNLKIAADVLDSYISDTLKKPSKVVKDWIDALLLQNIDFKANANITKGAFETITGEQPQTAKLAEKKLAEKEQKAVSVEPEPVQVVVSDIIEEKPKTESEKVSKLIAQAESVKSKSTNEALKILSEAFSIAQSLEDKNSMARVYAGIARVQNEANNLPKALDCLHASTVIAYSLGDNKLKTENHKQMARIYDDAGYLEPAISHYFASVAIDGVLDDSDNQADTLNSIGKMYTQRYIADEAVEYYKDALDMAKVKKNLSMMSDIFSNTAKTFKNAGENDKAMDNLKQAAILSQKVGNKAGLVEVYEQAADLMQTMNHLKKAADLYKKSYRYAEQLNDKESLVRLREKIMLLAA